MKILICVPVYNRKRLTPLILDNLNKYKDDATLWVYNDHSTLYDNDYLEPYCDKVIKLPISDKIVVKNETNIAGMGVQHLRWHQFRTFLDMDYDAIYLTDNDALHDPKYISVLKNVFKKYKMNGGNLPISIYNTRWHSNIKNQITEYDDVYLRKTAPGISQFYTKDLVYKIVQVLNKQKNDPDYAWDYRCVEYLNLPVVTTKTSFVEHFGADTESLHATAGNWNFDRAINPTKYLIDKRNDIINYMELRSDVKPSL